MTNDVDFLKDFYIFKDLDQQEIEFIAQIMAPRRYQEGDVIMKEGEPGESMYVISEGSVQIHKALTMKFGDDDFRETEKTLTVLRAEDHAVAGEMALITEDKRSATVTALTECLLYRITRDDFLGLAEKRPDLGFKVMHRLAKLVSQRLKKSGDDVIRLTTALSIALSQ